MSKQRARGTAAESAVVRYLVGRGFTGARRQTLAGALDRGDVWIDERAIAEVKSYSGAASLGQPGPAQLQQWLAETERERVNAGVDVAVLVVKRAGTTDPGKWWAYAPATHLAPWADQQAWIMTTFASWLALLEGSRPMGGSVSHDQGSWALGYPHTTERASEGLPGGAA